MGRKREHDRHLPRRMSCNHGKKRDTYYFRALDGTKIRLGHDLAAALIEYANLVGESATVTMADLIDAYIVERLPALRLSTQKDYTRILTRLRAGFGAMLPHSVKPKDIYDYRNLWPGPRGNRHVAVLSSVMELGVEKGVVVHNPCREIKRRTEKARDRYVTDEEYLALFRFAPERLRIAMDHAVYARAPVSVIHVAERADEEDPVRVGDIRHPPVALRISIRVEPFGLQLKKPHVHVDGAGARIFISSTRSMLPAQVP